MALPRSHQKYEHRRNTPNTRIVYSNTNTIYASTIRRKRSTRNTKQKLRRYVTWLQKILRNTLYRHTRTALLGFVLLTLLPLWTTYKPTMELSSQKNYNRTRLNWMQNGTRLLPSQYYALALKTENYFPKQEKSHSPRKRSSALYTLP